MPSASILEIKNIIRSVTRDQTRQIAEEAMGMTTGLEVDNFLKKKLREILPDIYSVPGM